MTMAAPIVSRSTAKAATAVVSKSKRKPPTTGQRNARTATREYAKRQQHKVATAQQISQNNFQIRQAEQAQRSAVTSKQQRRSKITGVATDVVKTPFEQHGTINAGHKSVVNPIMLILFTWAGIVLMYALITSPDATNGFLRSMRTWIGLVYQTKPMFTSSQTGAT